MSHNHEHENKDQHPTTSEQNLELDDNELSSVAGGWWLSPLPPPGAPDLSKLKDELSNPSPNLPSNSGPVDPGV